MKNNYRFQNRADTWCSVNVALPHMNNIHGRNAWSDEVLVWVKNLPSAHRLAVLAHNHDQDKPAFVSDTGQDITPYVVAWMSIPEYTEVEL